VSSTASLSARETLRAQPLLMVLALTAVWIFWGSTFAAMRITIATIPPFVMASLRFTAAGLILWLVCALRGRGRASWNDWKNALVTGSTLLLFGNGVTAWCVQYVPTGMSSLLLSLSPAWMGLFAFAFTRERPSRFAVIGMIVGFAGLALLLTPKASGHVPLVPTLLLVFASMSWAFGSIYQRMAPNTNIVLATALQMIVGGVTIGIEAQFFGEWSHFSPADVSLASLGGITWLVLFGSLAGYTAYLWTMQNVPVALASTYGYINPVVALILGAVLFGERLTPLAFIASAIILCGVALMMIPSPRARRSRPLRPARTSRS
jgi:drug/metabolite transporter (DMT)-like permease